MRLAYALPLVVGLLGCSGEPPYKGDKRYPVQGTVKFNDEPVNNGMISFVGESGDPTKQFTAGAPIFEGKYSIEANRGPNAGRYRVEIRWSKPTGKKRKDPDTGEMIDETKEAIPAKYHSNSTTIVDVKEGENTFDFDLKK
jgi:hypothetical protein